MNKDEYRAYLRSAHWRRVKERYRASKLPQACFCGETRVDLHHKTYKRIGRERLSDLTPLCRAHHDEEHGVGKPKVKKPRRETKAQKRRRLAPERRHQRLVDELAAKAAKIKRSGNWPL